MEKVIEAQIITEIVKLATGVNTMTSLVFWVLSNCIQSAPGLVIPLLGRDLLDLTMDLFEKGDGTVRSDAIIFCASLLLFCPHKWISEVISEKMLGFVIQGLDGNASATTVWCLNAIGRVFFLGLTGEGMTSSAGFVLRSEKLMEYLSPLQNQSDIVILNKVKTLRSEIESWKDEVLGGAD
jgi:hypothetical protein